MSGPAKLEWPKFSRALAVIPIAVSAAAWAVIWLALPPREQDFPLGDDWAFSRGVFAFARGQGIHYYYFASIPQLGQWLWALPFVWLFPDSHFVLRIAALVLSWLGLGAFHGLLRQEGVSSGRAALATAVLALNPLFFLMQGTFLTDAPALAFALSALAGYARALRSGRFGWLAAGAALATLAVLTRQNMIVVPVAALIVFWRSGRLRTSSGWPVMILVPVLIGVAVHVWFNSRPDVKALSPRPVPPQIALLMPFLILHWCGLAALPILLLTAWWKAWKVFASVFVLMIGCVLYWSYYAQLLPYGSPFPYTTGMLSLNGAFTPGLVVGERPVLLTPEVRWAITMLGCLGGAGLVAAVAAGRPQISASMLLTFTLLNIPFLFIVPALYDRYLLMLIPGAVFLACKQVEWRPFRLAPGILAAAVMGVVSVALMHDWLAWNAARWTLGRRALARQIPPAKIEGGFEWDGWHTSGRFPPVPRKNRSGFTLPVALRSFPEVTGEFALSYSLVPGAVLVDQEPYTVWLPPERRTFYLLQAPPTAAPLNADAARDVAPP